MIPFANTTISIYRPREEDPYDASDPLKVAVHIRAHIGSPSGRDHHVGGNQEVVNAKLGCDPCDLRHGDTVRDERSSERFLVVWVQERAGLGIDHLEAGLNLVAGAASG
jgi:hypothetical protein